MSRYGNTIQTNGSFACILGLSDELSLLWGTNFGDLSSRRTLPYLAYLVNLTGKQNLELMQPVRVVSASSKWNKIMSV